ncbi:MAG: hypothetical protein JWP89_3494 [Schlesneria sp.]|nr:hypothetical protein [Schlesneria sp.]
MTPRLQRIFVHTCATAICIGGVAIVVWCIQFKQSSVDLMSGRERDRFSICGLCVREQVRETSFSKILQSGGSAEPDWRVVFETGPVQRVSPHFTHHSTPTTLKEAVLVGELLEAPEGVRRKKCEQVLELLRHDDRTRARKLLDDWWNEGRPEQREIEASLRRSGLLFAASG